MFLAHMIEEAIKQAKFSDHKNHKIGCVVVDRKNRIISTGYNCNKTHPVQAHYAQRCGNDAKIFLHAEISALVRCKGDPYAIYVARLSKYGTRLAKPCKICMAAIIDSGIKRIYYTNNDGGVSEINL